MTTTSDPTPTDTPNRISFNEYVDILCAQLDHMIQQRTASHDDPGEWLRSLYNAYLKRMLSDNQRIWSTGAILLPLSLSAFAAVAALQTRTLLKTGLLAFASIILMWAWIVIAENHRAFQEKSRAWLVAIENRIGIARLPTVKIWDDRRRPKKTPTQAPAVQKMPCPPPPKTWYDRHRPSTIITQDAAVQKMRWLIAYLTTGAWFLVILRDFFMLLNHRP